MVREVVEVELEEVARGPHEPVKLLREARRAVGREAHHLALVAVAREAEPLGHRGVERAERVRGLDPLQHLERRTFAVREHRADSVAERVDRQDSGVLEAGDEERARQVRDVVLHVMPFTGPLRVEPPARILRQRLLEAPDGDDVRRREPGLGQAPGGSLLREACRVLHAVEALLLRGRDKLTVDDEGRSGVAVVRVQAEDCRQAAKSRSYVFLRFRSGTVQRRREGCSLTQTGKEQNHASHRPHHRCRTGLGRSGGRRVRADLAGRHQDGRAAGHGLQRPAGGSHLAAVRHRRLRPHGQGRGRDHRHLDGELRPPVRRLADTASPGLGLGVRLGRAHRHERPRRRRRAVDLRPLLERGDLQGKARRRRPLDRPRRDQGRRAGVGAAPARSSATRARCRSASGWSRSAARSVSRTPSRPGSSARFIAR